MNNMCSLYRLMCHCTVQATRTLIYIIVLCPAGAFFTFKLCTAMKMLLILGFALPDVLQRDAYSIPCDSVNSSRCVRSLHFKGACALWRLFLSVVVGLVSLMCLKCFILTYRNLSSRLPLAGLFFLPFTNHCSWKNTRTPNTGRVNRQIYVQNINNGALWGVWCNVKLLNE